MKIIELFCTGCNILFVKELKEVTRQRKNGNYNFYCNSKCFGVCHTKVIRCEYRHCDYCEGIFLTDYTTDTKHCSRSCASVNSVTDYRREKAVESGTNNYKNISGIDTIAKGLRNREMWKYAEISKFLNERNIFHEFEFPLERFVFDLALFDKEILIEFDGSYHADGRQKPTDYQKAVTAFTYGWTIKRVNTSDNEVLSPELISSFI